ncbi:hypothetical protein SAMN04488069_11918 [Hymenobacter psychrophilus]|uniref:Uncharacterized protein n=1 Tax=Hymenobacter psychrophilus TaxID=651662 RepID=A0A1H3NUQ0_9BACT|nr:hypothetical protein SAMN04488069_11918 [Hymenobacter psychrophilus]
MLPSASIHGEQAGDTVRVTLYREPNPVLVREAEVLACLDDAGVLTSFNACKAEDRRALLHEVFSQPDATRQEKKILALIATLDLQSTTR